MNFEIVPKNVYKYSISHTYSCWYNFEVDETIIKKGGSSFNKNYSPRYIIRYDFLNLLQKTFWYEWIKKYVYTILKSVQK